MVSSTTLRTIAVDVKNKNTAMGCATPFDSEDVPGLLDASDGKVDIPSELKSPVEDASTNPDSFKWSDVVEWIENFSDDGDGTNVDVPKTEVVDVAPEITTPSTPTAKFFSELPCAFPSSLRYDDKSKKLYTTCGGEISSLYAKDLTDDPSAEWENVADFSGYPSNHVIAGNGLHFVAHSMPDGLTLVDENANSVSDEIIFENEDTLFFTPNNPSGMALLGGSTVCLTTSNLNHVDMDPALTTYFTGTVVCYEYKDGLLSHNEALAFSTSGINPTGVYLIDKTPNAYGEQRLAVLSSNSYAPGDNQNAMLDIFTWPSMAKETSTIISLSGLPVTAQISPDIAMTDGGVILVGIQKPSAAVAGISAEDGDFLIYNDTPEVKNFISSIQAFGNVAAISDFGVFGEATSRVVFMNYTGAWSNSVETEVEGSLGPSVIVGDTLYQTSTTPDMSGGNIWEIGLTGIK